MNSWKAEHRAVIQRAVRKLGVEVASDQILRLLAKVNEVHHTVGGTRQPAALQVQATAVLVAWAIRVVRDGGQRGEMEAVAPRSEQRVDPIALLRARPLVSPGEAAAKASSPYTLHISRRGSIELVAHRSTPARFSSAGTSGVRGRGSVARTSGVRGRASARRPSAAPTRRVAARASPPGRAQRAGGPSTSSSRIAKVRRRASPPRSERTRAPARPHVAPVDEIRSRGLALEILRRAEQDESAAVEHAAAAKSADPSLRAEADRPGFASLRGVADGATESAFYGAFDGMDGVRLPGEEESESTGSEHPRGSPMLERDSSISPNDAAPVWPGTAVPLSATTQRYMNAASPAQSHPRTVSQHGGGILFPLQRAVFVAPPRSR